MEQIKILYIDDKPDTDLDRYLDKYYKNENYSIEYDLIQFNPNDGYESLLQDTRVQTANVILIDSWLFQNKTAVSGKFTGEEFKMVLQKFYQYIEVIIITQNEKDSDIDMIEKYDLSNKSKTAQEYYADEIPQYINKAIDHIHQLRIIALKISQNDSWEKLLKEKVLDTLNGTNKYDSLTKDDIDELVSAFKLIQEEING